MSNGNRLYPAEAVITSGDVGRVGLSSVLSTTCEGGTIDHYLSYFPIAVIKQDNQGNLSKKALNQIAVSGGESMTFMVGSIAAGRQAVLGK